MFDALCLHRIAASTLMHNVRSQRVLAKNGFAQIRHAPAYLKIDDRWQDHTPYQALAPSPSPEVRLLNPIIVVRARETAQELPRLRDAVELRRAGRRRHASGLH